MLGSMALARGANVGPFVEEEEEEVGENDQEEGVESDGDFEEGDW
jgi:hypothetical protein